MIGAGQPPLASAGGAMTSDDYALLHQNKNVAIQNTNNIIMMQEMNNNMYKPR